MKKLLTILLCVLLLSIAFLPAQAASGHMQLSSSNANLNRGSTFTITVNLSNSNVVRSGGIVLNYDQNVFELIGGTCHISDLVMGPVTSANNGGMFLVNTPAVVSGRIFTINMRVKDNAPFGSYTISGTPSLLDSNSAAVSCSVGGTTVSVVCNHNYGSSTKVDSSTHKSTCSICGNEKTVNHIWNSGEVIKKATCKETGTKKFTCTACGATKEETISKTTTHDYRYTSKENSTHTQTCSVCGDKKTSNHTWNSGEVIKKATCKDTGTKKLTCTGCGATKEETISKTTTHDYRYTSKNNSTHTLTCSVCGDKKTSNHSYGGWQHGEEEHYQVCTTCGHKANQQAHEPGPEATETTDQICTVCNRVLKAKFTHKHVFFPDWESDETNHWHNCNDCDEKDSLEEHIFDDDCDTTCDTCDYTRQPLHTPALEWTTDVTGHWRVCTGCGEKLEVADHIPGEEATLTTPQTCTLCGFELAPIIPHEHSYDPKDNTHRHLCECGHLYEADAEECEVCPPPIPWMYICIGEAGVFLLCLLIILLVMKRKRKYDYDGI